MNKQKQKQQKKLSYISLMAVTIAITGVFFVSNMILPSNAQSTSTGSIDVESVKSLLDQAVEAVNNGDTAVALQQLDKAENSLDIAEDKLEAMLGGSSSGSNNP
jgi:hypothetical protein